MGHYRRLGVALIAALAFAATARAHTTGTGLLALTVSGSTLQYHLTLVPSELPEATARLLVLAANGDRASVERVADELHRRVQAGVGNHACRPGGARIHASRVDSRVNLDLTLTCPSASGRLVIREDWFDLLGEHYRTIARIETPVGVQEAVFLADAREVSIDLGATASASRGGFFRL